MQAAMEAEFVIINRISPQGREIGSYGSLQIESIEILPP
jgi:hypothetical protein